MQPPPGLYRQGNCHSASTKLQDNPGDGGVSQEEGLKARRFKNSDLNFLWELFMHAQSLYDVGTIYVKYMHSANKVTAYN